MPNNLLRHVQRQKGDQFVVDHTSYVTDSSLTRKNQTSGYVRQREGLQLGLKFPLVSNVGWHKPSCKLGGGGGEGVATPPC